MIFVAIPIFVGLAAIVVMLTIYASLGFFFLASAYPLAALAVAAGMTLLVLLLAWYRQ